MSDVTDFRDARWNSRTMAKDHQPIEALEAVIRRISAGTLAPEHCVVVMHVPEGEDGRTVIFQAGSLSWLAQVGLLSRAKDIISNDIGKE